MKDDAMRRKSDPKYDEDLVNYRFLKNLLKNFSPNNGNSIADVVPIGIIVAYPGDVAPNGWLLMGPDYSRTAYPELYAVIGTKFGAGDGSTTFGTNTKGRVFVGLDTSQTEFNIIGKLGGHKLLQAHEHAIEPYGGRGGYGSAGHTGIIAQTGGTTYNSYYASSTGGGDSQNLQPYIVTNRIIKAFNVAMTNPVSTVENSTDSDSTTNSASVHLVKQVKDMHNNENWITPTLLNSWVVFGGTEYSTPGYYKHDGRVYLRGLVKSGTTFSPIFVLPEGYRPTYREIFSIISNNALGRLDIKADGTVILDSLGNNGWVSLSGISFRID